ncbi:MAG: type II toxin-antitoxin system VapB family antitoxin [Gammaproteobacteria bacterium]|nr:hypothetical protein [Rhodospirillaceae bacterium]MDE0365694.1 type II toxin-antitoxin system VapB family antitoxin [Gammaproteobacteria bacterium]
MKRPNGCGRWRLSRIKTKRALINRVLPEFVAHRQRLDPGELEGASLPGPDYDHKAPRAAGGC